MRDSLIGSRSALLQALRPGPAYGVELSERVSAATAGHVRLAQGSLYPALKSLEKDGLIRGVVVVPGGRRGGRARTYYELTVAGVQASDENRTALRGLLRSVGASAPSAPDQALLADRLRRANELYDFVRRGRAAMGCVG